jgi:amino acid adenylation domain-containing protein/FkbH-like protein
MSVLQILEEVQKAGGKLYLSGSELKIRAPRGALNRELRSEIHLCKKALAEHLRQSDAADDLVQLVPSQRPDHLPLSFAQERLWFLDQLQPGGSEYNMVASSRFRGAFDAAVFERSVAEVTKRHEALRTRFESSSGEAYQVIDPPGGFRLEFEDLSSIAGGAGNEQISQRVREEGARPFNLARGPLFRVRVLRLASDDHIALIVIHHIICDGWSLRVLGAEIKAIFEVFSKGLPCPLPELPIQYADYVRWQRQRLQGATLEAQLEYWRGKLSGASALQLPTDRARPTTQSFSGAATNLTIPAKLLASLGELAIAEGTTIFMVLLAAFQVVLARWSGQEDIVIGTPIAGRNRSELEPLVGFFVNTLALRTDMTGNPPFRVLLSRVKEVAFGAYEHQEVPFEKIVETLQPVRDLSRHPIFQILLNALDFDATNSNATAAERPSNGTRAASPVLQANNGSPLTPIGGAESKFDLTLYFRNTGDLRLFAVYNVDLFDRATIERLLHHYHNVLDAIAADANKRLWELPLLGTAERRQLVEEWNETAADYPRDKCLHELFSEQAAKTPDAVALVYEDSELSYGELELRSNQLAHHLRGLGVGPESIVGLCVDRSVEMVVGLLGILKAGGAYLPLDPGYPKERLAYMLADAAASVVVTQASEEGRLGDVAARKVRLDVERSEIERHPAIAPSSAVRPDNLAYVIYTSGSTGKPKGVMVEHRQVTNYTFGVTCRLPFERLRNFAMVQSLMVGSAITVIYPALLFGATLHIISRDRSLDADACRKYFIQHSIDCLKIAPSHLAALMAASEHPSDLLPSLVVVAGEPSPSAWMAATMASNASSRIFNHYGATETTIGVLTHAVTSDLQADIPNTPLGRPLPNCKVYVLDRELNPTTHGVAGEIYVAGDSLTRGYLGSAALTAEKFIPDPFSSEGTRLYCTNDLGRWQSDGVIQYLCRQDNQVKVRGFRIELGEIEATLLKNPKVQQAIVLPQIMSPTEKRLIAYVAPKKGPSLEVGEIREHLASSLPDYMLPSAIVILGALPRTAHGKIDRRALPVPEDQTAIVDFEAPQTPTEQVLAGIWCEVLRQKRISIHDDFFGLGGHSLLATRVIARVRDSLGIELPVRTLFESPVLAELAGRIERLRREGQWALPAMTAKQRVGYLPLSFAQERLWILDQLQPGGSEYNIPIAALLDGVLDIEALERSLSELVRRHEVLRTRFEVADGNPVQVIDEPRNVELTRLDLLQLDGEQPEAALRRQMSRLISEPFDLTTGPLLRATLVRLSAERHAVILVLHHIISDGWSRGILVGELSRSYAAYVKGLPSPLPALTLQYADYARWQRDWLQGEVLERRLEYWRTKLSGAPVALKLPADRARPPVQSFKGATFSFHLSSELSTRLSALARGEGATLFMVLLAAFEVVLARWSGQEDIVVGTPIAGRTHREIEGLIGFFVNTLVLRADLSGDPSFRELLDRVKMGALEAYEHQDFPFEKLVQELRPERDLSRQPLFQVMFALQNMPGGTPNLPGIDLHWISGEGATSKFDLSLFLFETANGLSGWFEYATGLFDPATMERMLRQFKLVLENAVSTPDAQLSELNALLPPPAVEISISSTFTADPVAEPIWFWTERMGLTAQVNTTGFNQVLQSLLAQPPLHKEPHQFHLILLRLEDWGQRMKVDAYDQKTTININDIERNVDDFIIQLRNAAPLGKGHCLVGICPASPDVLGLRNHALRLQAIEERLIEACRIIPQTRVLPLDATAKALQLVTVHDTYLDKIAHIPYSQQLFAVAATSAMRALFDAKRHIYKVLVVDCDNTLWKGVCGEDGPLGVTIGHGRRSLQEYLVQLAGKGVLVCLCSRNNEADVLEVFQSNSDMVLSLNEIASYRIGWGSKPSAIAELAKELDLGLDSLVFLDDDPVECARMEADQPEVLTLNLPASDDEVPAFLNRLWMFDDVGATSEDQQRTRRYREEGQRREVRQRAGSLQEFIRGLELRIVSRLPEEKDIERVVQLTERTTQFNTTGLALRSDGFKELMKATDKLCLIVEVSDRFGDYGSSGLLLIDRSEPVWRIELFALSCRVLARDVEFRIVERLVEEAQKVGGRDLAFEFRPTARNIPVQAFLRELYRLSGNSQELRPLNIFALRELAAGLEHRRRAGVPELTAVEPEASQVRQSQPASELDFKTAKRRFSQLVATQYRTVGEIVRTLGFHALRPSRRTAIYEAARTPTEVTLVTIWAEVLRLERVGLQDNFFELGGHSLLATQVIARVNDRLGVELPLRAVFEAPTVAGFCLKLQEREERTRLDQEAELKKRVASMSPEEIRATLQRMKASA